MKKTLRCSLVALVSLVCCSCFSAISAEVTLEVLNPLGEISPPPTMGINARIPDLNGKTVALLRVDVARYPDGTISDWTSTVTLDGAEREIRVNHPLSSGSAKILQSGYGRAYDISLRLPGDAFPRDILLPQDAALPLTRDGSVELSLSPPLDGLISEAMERGESMRSADIVLSGRGRVMQRATAFIGTPVGFGDTGISLTIKADRPYSVLLVRKAPGLWALWASLGILGLSACGAILSPRGEADKKENP